VSFWRGRAVQKAVASACYLPVLELRGRGVEQARIPRQGTVITRPSRNETLRASSVNSTPGTRSSAADVEKLIPSLREAPRARHDELYLAQLVSDRPRWSRVNIRVPQGLKPGLKNRQLPQR
jgi:hypothetical protein